MLTQARLWKFCLLFTYTLLHGMSAATWAAELPQILLPKSRLQAEELAIIVNDRDPLSRQIAEYYQQRRNIPAENIIHIQFEVSGNKFSAQQFATIKQQVDRQTPERVQAYALTWLEPYRVECMSITSAFAFGFDRRWCSSETCALTAVSPYFNSRSSRPYRELKIRPTLVIAATNLQQARALIDRGVASDATQPPGTAYLVTTQDRKRNVRSRFYPAIEQRLSGVIETRNLQTAALRDRHDVLFYFTGAVSVDHLDSLKFRPGALADHLTSAGGLLTDSKQMSALRWLEAGATGSYGTVVEPCAHTSKFPHPWILMQHYLRGETLIEAYWKSVQMPGEGIFIGEPLAAPFDFLEIGREPGMITVRTQSLVPGRYQLETAPTSIGPFQPTGQQAQIGFPVPQLRLPDTGSPVYRLKVLRYD